MKRPVLFAIASLAAASASLLAPALARAADAYVTGNVSLRAGPDPDYPLIDQIPAGTEVDVQGCTEGWEWCDVIVYGDRGWVAGNFIEYEYQDQPVLLPAYGARIGIPVVTFVIVDYWDHYYRDRPFYRERDRWYGRPVVRRPPPPPISRPYRGRPETTDSYRRDQRHDSRDDRPAPGHQDSDRRGPANREHAVHVEPAGGPPQRVSEPVTHPGNQRGPVQGQPPAHGRSQGKPAQHRDDRDKRDDNDGH
jgi:uncharacterized protein YraI